MPRRLLTLSLAATAALAVLTAPASAASTTKMTLAVEITGIHVVDWTFAGEGHPDQCRVWPKGNGTQTTGFSTRRPVRYTGLGLQGAPAGAPKFTLLAVGKPSYRATIERKGVWEENVPPTSCSPCGPNSEFGECADDDLLPPPIRRDCGRRKVASPMGMLTFVPAGVAGDDDLEPPTDSLDVAMVAPAGDLFRNCPPTLPRSAGHALEQPDPLPIKLGAAQARRLTRLAVGRKLTLKGSAERGLTDDAGKKVETRRCATPSGGSGYRECAVTDVTVEIRRTR